MKQGNIFQWSSDLNIGDLPNQSSTLLVPDDLMAALDVILEQRDFSMGEYLAFLAEKYGMTAGQKKLPVDHQKLTTQYQEEGLSLERQDFRVDPRVWHVLKCMARAHGMSICKFFVILLVLELSSEKEGFFGVPTINALPEEMKSIYYILFYEELRIEQQKNTRELEMSLPPPDC